MTNLVKPHWGKLIKIKKNKLSQYKVLNNYRWTKFSWYS